jgi:hypothetical protein
VVSLVLGINKRKRKETSELINTNTVAPVSTPTNQPVQEPTIIPTEPSQTPTK